MSVREANITGYSFPSFPYYNNTAPKPSYEKSVAITNGRSNYANNKPPDTIAAITVYFAFSHSPVHCTGPSPLVRRLVIGLLILLKFFTNYR